MWVERPPELSEEHLASASAKAMASGLLPLRDCKGRYFHWDDLRHREIPDEHKPRYPSHMEYWAGIKFARITSATHLPLNDTKGGRFWYCPLAMERLASKIRRSTASVAGEAEGDVRHEDLADLRASLMREAICSSQIEGAATTYAVAKQMLLHGREPSDHGERMIFNNYRAIRFIMDESKRPLTVDLIRELHKILTEGTLEREEDAGRIRGSRKDDENFRVMYGEKTVHIPPSWDELEQRMAQLCEFANSGDESEPYVDGPLRAMILHFAFAYAHPFIDGNGRTSRALYYWAMERRGYWLAKYASISSIVRLGTRDYARSYLLSESDGGDITYFLDYHAELILKSLQNHRERIRAREAALRELGEQLRKGKAGEDWNLRQRKLLAYALQAPETEYTSESHATVHHISKPTALSDLDALADVGYLVKSRKGRKHLYHAAANLRDILKPYAMPQSEPKAASRTP